jgi:Fe-S cluster biogenesis protein NfuA
MSPRVVGESILNRIRPFIVADGGDIKLVAFDGDSVCIRLMGACADCPGSRLTLRQRARDRAAHRTPRPVRRACGMSGRAAQDNRS